MDNCCYDHIDFRVRDLRKLSRFYDRLMPALGMRVIHKGGRWRGYYHKDRRLPFFGLIQSVTTVPGRTRIAFAALSRKDVDKITAVARRAGAKSIDGPQICKEYHQPYYAVFFEDPDGNKLEICCRY